MIRLVHSQIASGSILVSDIDDGLPNKTARRTVAPQYSYERDGYAQAPKQPCYLPRVDPANPALPGHIDLELTDRVLMSVNRGQIAGFVKNGLITATLFAASDVAAPDLTSAVLDVLGTGDLTLTGTGFTSLEPYTSSVVITGDGAVTLTPAQIVAEGGTFTSTSIVVPAALLTDVSTTTSSCEVLADNQVSSTVVVS